jgi:hypothetical protein
VTVQAGGALAASRPTGLWQVLWSLVTTGMLLVMLAFAWLVGSQAVRRVQAQQAGATISATAAASGATGGSPSVDPKVWAVRAVLVLWDMPWRAPHLPPI